LEVREAGPCDARAEGRAELDVAWVVAQLTRLFVPHVAAYVDAQPLEQRRAARQRRQRRRCRAVGPAPVAATRRSLQDAKRLQLEPPQTRRDGVRCKLGRDARHREPRERRQRRQVRELREGLAVVAKGQVLEGGQPRQALDGGGVLAVTT
jgi:hypothetical protein